MISLWSCIVGPRVYRLYEVITAANETESQSYTPNTFEKCGNQIMQGINIMWNIGLYTSPLIVTYLWRREYFCLMGCVSVVKFGMGIGLLMVVALALRGLGRNTNSQYTTFLKKLNEAQANYNSSNKLALSKYDCDFWAWPADFYWNEVEGEDSKPRVYVDRNTRSGRTGGAIRKLITLPCHIAAWCVAHLFGRHLMYPGSIQLLQVAMDPYLQAGREKLVKEFSGTRGKLVARDGNSIDTMFVDRRKRFKSSKKLLPSLKEMGTAHTHGSILVVCCEGNAGFYEVGNMMTPLEAGYSVLGWNHPGFAGSTGTPFPVQEQNAIDVVMQYAIHKLNFTPENIVIYAWSIGGYVGTWAAMNYPQIRGLVLDATFDDVLPLAIPRMPGWMSGLVVTTIREHLNLCNADQLSRYPGPVTIIRRTKDEIITTQEFVLASNRGNDLLIKLLRSRYPKLMSSGAVEVLTQWLAEEPVEQASLVSKWAVDSDYCQTLLNSYIDEHSASIPMQIGEDLEEEEKTRMVLFLASKYLVDFVSGHNTPLEVRFFRVPWTPIADTSYVQVD
ncbi:phosphatidylserine lipase ABHD16A isoform X2 [Oratosquilla oratoria]|uniref:phosphatidylserine lipase ABHD16A isoform X2 n=1 Tax=Oratosquilla oratoria TaxID=337810 RepID=UPI003F764182